MDFYLIKWDEDLEDAAFIKGHPDSIGVKGYEFGKTKPLLKQFKANSQYKMSRINSKERVLYSWVYNIMTLPIISNELKKIFESAAGSDFEFLPITILNQRDKVESTEYVIAHPLSVVDAIDVEKSIFKFSPITPGKFQTWQKIILNEEKVPQEIEIFRFKQIFKAIIISDPLKQRIEADEAITGVKFIPLDKFTSRSI